MQIFNILTIIIGVWAQHIMAGPIRLIKPLDLNSTNGTTCYKELKDCIIIAPGPEFRINLWVPEIASNQREDIEEYCGVTTEFWNVQTFPQSAGLHSLEMGCVPGHATFKLSSGSRDPIQCVENALTKAFVPIRCRD